MIMNRESLGCLVMTLAASCGPHPHVATPARNGTSMRTPEAVPSPPPDRRSGAPPDRRHGAQQARPQRGSVWSATPVDLPHRLNISVRGRRRLTIHFENTGSVSWPTVEPEVRMTSRDGSDRYRALEPSINPPSDISPGSRLSLQFDFEVTQVSEQPQMREILITLSSGEHVLNRSRIELNIGRVVRHDAATDDSQMVRSTDRILRSCGRRLAVVVNDEVERESGRVSLQGGHCYYVEAPGASLSCGAQTGVNWIGNCEPCGEPPSSSGRVVVGGAVGDRVRIFRVVPVGSR